MPRVEDIPGSPSEWLARAKADLALARIPLPDGAVYEDLCRHAQQAAEKAIKAVYLRHGWAFRYVHNLEELITGLRELGLHVPEDVGRSADLTAYAHRTRYPRVGEPVTKAEHRTAVELAAAVVVWVESELAERDG